MNSFPVRDAQLVPISPHRGFVQQSRRSRAYADAAIRAELAARLQKLEELVGKLAFSLSEIKGVWARKRALRRQGP